MEVMLIEPVPHLGDRGDIVNVAPGYARNYLLPKGLAAPVSKEAVQRVEAARRRAEQAEAERRAALKEVAERLAAASVTITAAATEEGHLYGSVSAADIAEHLRKEGFEVTEDMVGLEEHIKELGVYPVPVTLEQEITAEVKVWVVQE